MKDPFLQDLESVFPKWQEQFTTLRAAACAAGLLDEYDTFLDTPRGRVYRAATEGVPDTVAQNAAERRMRERLLPAFNNEEGLIDDPDSEPPAEIEEWEAYVLAAQHEELAGLTDDELGIDLPTGPEYHIWKDNEDVDT